MNKPEDRLAHWINERYRIYHNRTIGHPPPWTEDPILANYRFCNVHRENDKVTQWIAKHWREPYAKYETLVPAMVLARMFNLPETLAWMGFPAQWREPSIYVDMIKNRRHLGHKIFNGAYLITTCGVKMDKIDYVFRVADDTRTRFDTLIGHNLTDTLENWHGFLTQVKGLGDFLAAQVIADLKNTPEHPLQQAPDRLTWCAPGPGSLRGLARLTGLPKAPRALFMGQAQAAYQAVAPRLAPMPPIDMQDFQNCLCEFDKYERTYLNEGKPKQRYHYVRP